MNPRRLRIWEWLTGLAGVTLLGAMFLDWYEAAPGGASAWESFTVLDVLLTITALMAIAVAVMAAAHNAPAVSLAIASMLLVVGTIATIAVLIRLLALPEVTVDGVTAPDEDVSRAIGLWIGLAATAVVTGGSLGTMRDQRFPEAARVEVPVETIAPPEGGNA